MSLIWVRLALSEPPRFGEGNRARTSGRGGGVLSATPTAFKTAKRERRSGNPAEVRLWTELRKRPGGYKFRRQHPIGPYVLDFACLAVKLAIEIDGEAHNRADRPERDQRRDLWLGEQGFAVLRLPAILVFNDLEAALAAIMSECQRPLHPSAMPNGPPPRAGEV